MGKLPEIVKLFQHESKSQLPVAIIQNGTTVHEKVGIATVDTILGVVEKEELSNPAIIVIGEVVNHRIVIENVQRAYSKTRIAS
jgi:uroporphyrin-III C-methyltransferase